ncbi:MAG: hypothetical protein JXB07_17900 [Anaerolineae bacterium]|nr:hypothetical protein [Anaerolineae bacterium]
MSVEPKYAENIIVAVAHRREWSWYVSAKELWVMDWRRWAEDWGQNPDETDYSSRFGIEVLDVSTAKTFFQRMGQYRETTGFLRNLVGKVYDYRGLKTFKFEEQAELLADLWHLIPSLLLDFDNKQLISNYPETDLVLEHYMPTSWTVKGTSLFEVVPSAHRYWIIDGRDAMTHFSEILYQMGGAG